MADARQKPPAEPAVFFLIILIQLVSAAGLTVLYSMLAGLFREYAGSSINMGWAVTAYLFVAASAGALCGRLSDVFGRRVLLLWMLAIAAIGALISILAPSPLWVIGGCAMQGIAGALNPIDIAVAKDRIPAKRLPLAIAAITAAGTAGSGLIYLSAGWITDHFASHGAFIMKLVLAVVTFVMVLIILPRDRPDNAVTQEGKKINYLRGMLFIIPLGAFLVAIDRSHVWGLLDMRTLGLTAASLLGLWLWAGDQRRQTTPLIDISLLGNRTIALVMLAQILLGVGAIQIGQIFSLVLQQPVMSGAGFGLTAAAAGLLFIILNSTSALTSPLASGFIKVFGARWTAVLGALLACLAWGGLFYGDHELKIFGAFGIAIITAISFTMTGNFALVVDASPRGRVGEASGMAYVVFTIAMAIGSQIILTILTSSTVPDATTAGLALPSARAIHLTYMFVAATAAVMTVALFAVPHRKASAIADTAHEPV